MLDGSQSINQGFSQSKPLRGAPFRRSNAAFCPRSFASAVAVTGTIASSPIDPPHGGCMVLVVAALVQVTAGIG
jgi:hypothetical protein